MAVVEIAKIQIRRGDARTDGMPQLDTGELGWAISGTAAETTTPELFIGNRIQDGASVTTNTRILTVLDLPNIFGTSITTSSYYFSGHRGIDIYTGPGDTFLNRTVKEKLDDNVSLFDFVTEVNYLDPEFDFTVTLQRAIDELFLNSDKTSARARAALKIPAGEYSIASTIFLPAYASIVGEGKDKTIISMVSGAEALFQFVGLDSDPGLPEEIGDMSSGTSPRNITVSGMTLKYGEDVTVDATLPLLRADASIDSIINDVKFQGISPYATTNVGNTGIDIRGQDGITSKNLRITNCVFDTLHYGIKSDYDTEGTVIDSNRFENLSRGIVYFNDPQADIGPTKSRITRNIFNVIAKEAVLVAGTSTQYTDHILSENIYTNVGNNSSYASPGLGDIGGQVTNVLFLATSGNVSDYDTFSRVTEVNNTSTDVSFVLPVYGHVSLVDNRVKTNTIDSGTADGTVVKVAHSGDTTNVKVQYQITTSGISRWGDLTLICSSNTLTSTLDPNIKLVPITDNYNYFGSSDTGIVFEATYNLTTNAIAIRYTSNTASGTLTYQINQYY
jgi:hypothetical protein